MKSCAQCSDAEIDLRSCRGLTCEGSSHHERIWLAVGFCGTIPEGSSGELSWSENTNFEAFESVYTKTLGAALHNDLVMTDMAVFPWLLSMSIG